MARQQGSGLIRSQPGPAASTPSSSISTHTATLPAPEPLRVPTACGVETASWHLQPGAVFAFGPMISRDPDFEAVLAGSSTVRGIRLPFANPLTGWLIAHKNVGFYVAELNCRRRSYVAIVAFSAGGFDPSTPHFSQVAGTSLASVRYFAFAAFAQTQVLFQ